MITRFPYSFSQFRVVYQNSLPVFLKSSFDPIYEGMKSQFIRSSLIRRNGQFSTPKKVRKWSLFFLCCLMMLIIILLPMGLIIAFITKQASNSDLPTVNKWFHTIVHISAVSDSEEKETESSIPIPIITANSNSSTSDRTRHSLYPSSNIKESEELQINSGTEQLSIIQGIEETLRSHPFVRLTQNQTTSFLLQDYFVYLSMQPQCQQLPVFTSMANIFSELYWQLMENFFYSMVKFGLSSCSVMICVSDLNCMKRCKSSFFPCILFDYQKMHPDKSLPSALEQIAELKLFHLPKALEKGVNIIILDSDVGFLSNPMNLIQMIDPKVDMFVQKDIAYIMNRTLVGWKTWYTMPLPNIGIFYIKGNERTVWVFEEAWRRYLEIDPKRKNNPGKDQNQVAFAMRSASMMKGLKWQFFPASSAVLLDMVYKFNDPRYELGGTAALSILQPSNKTNALSKRHKMGEKTKDVGQVSDIVQAVHTTCYEQKNKVNGLKASNAFWNPYYYSITRKTITKKVIYVSSEQVRNEIRTLLYLGYVTNRSVIIPNILSESKRMFNPLDLYQDQSLWPFFRIMFYKPRLLKFLSSSSPSSSSSSSSYAVSSNDETTGQRLTIIEPAYYWRIERDYFMNKSHFIPKPFLVPFYHSENHANYYSSSSSSSKTKHFPFSTVKQLEERLLQPDIQSIPRIVLCPLPFIYSQSLSSSSSSSSSSSEQKKQPEVSQQQILEHHYTWAMDSVGKFLTYERELQEYELLPKINAISDGEGKEKDIYSVYSESTAAKLIVQETRLCDTLYRFDNGNRSCFNKCH